MGKEAWQLKVEEEDTDVAIIMILEGELTMRTAPDLRPRLQACYKKKAAHPIVIDLEGVRYMDSSGIATLVEALKNCIHQKRKLVLCSLSQTVYNVFEVANLDNIFDVHADRKAALIHLGGTVE